ncbi:sodium-dependent glucose transporter 1-like [Mizuhopecten yessoensis]|uniref:Sodium-dependent glucose transporter 1A n=1 Tax=Mizuhopecten yessoensis TaxID=6573 RepID=A0A210PZ46_MIZYE|nr:sodium-dependent glucose transporter 1-like [Mizuhopecten yessoensis]OWF41766.1 Sodium-dependent glucose transporter 1A [Mizuhopecten yessoensis]
MNNRTTTPRIDDKLSPEHKKKTKGPLITPAIKPCTYQGSKGSVEVLDIKVPIKQTSIQVGLGPSSLGAIPKQRSVSISLARDDEFARSPVGADNDNRREITYIGQGSLDTSAKGKGQHGGFIGRMRHDLTYRNKFFQTLSIFWAFSVLGWTIGQFGPSFLDLQVITGSSLREGSAFMTAHSVGYLLGSLTSGLVFDSLDKVLLVFYPVLGNAVTIAIIPWCSPYGLMVFSHWVKGLFSGGLDAVCNAETVYIWGDEGRSFMQALHFSFAMGGILAPMATAPFLVDDPDIRNLTMMKQLSRKQRSLLGNDTFSYDTMSSALEFTTKRLNTTIETMTYNITSFLNLSSSTSGLTFLAKKEQFNVTMSSLIHNTATPVWQNSTVTAPSVLNSAMTTIANALPLELPDEPSQLWKACTITSIMGLTASIPFIVMRLKRTKLEMASGRTDEDKLLRILPLATKALILFNMSLLLGTYSAIEDTFAGFLTTFCVKQMKWTKAKGSFATSVYWAAFGGGRFVGIFLVKMCDPVRIITVYSTLLVLSFVGLYCTSTGQFDGGVWVCAFLGGFALSVIFPTIFTWTEAELLPVTGKIASIFLIASSSGTMVNPIVLGYLMDSLTPMWFCYLLLGESIAMYILFLSALNISRIVKNRQRQSSLELETDNYLPEEEEEEEEDYFDDDDKIDVATEEEKEKLLAEQRRQEFEEMMSARSMCIDMKDIDYDNKLIFIDTLKK